MSDETRHDGLADVINLLAAPIAGGIRTVEQFKRGVDEMFRAIENLNRTMENLNEAAARVNRLIGEIEGPVRAMMPQITRTVQTADEITSMLEAPVRATAPKVERIVDALGSPGFLALPNQFGELMQRLAPLTQLAESAGGLFGGFRIPGTTRAAATSPAPPPAPVAQARSSAVAPYPKTATKKAASKKAASKKTASKKTGAKRAAKSAAR
jgi:ABC-type transporter Mla subunit MlaD